MKNVLKFFVVSFAVANIAHVAYGGIILAPSLEISDGVDPAITIIDNGPGDLNATIGAVTMSTNMGVWSLSISTGVTAPALGSFTNPVMDLVIQASSTGAGSLTYTFSDIGFSHGPGTLNAAVSGQVIAGASTKIDYSVYGNGSDTLGALTTLLATTGTNSLPISTSTSGALALSSPFSLSQVVQLTASGASAVSVDASLNVIPEPSTAALMFVGLAVFVAGLVHRRRSLHRIG
jgi:PEP-CTERM motif-containing protein